MLNWTNQKDFNLNNYFNDSSIGCFLEVDVDYPYKLHDLHNKYSLAGEKIVVTSEMLSDYQLKVIEDNNCFVAKKKRSYS